MDDYGQSVSKCPACGNSILTPADAAAHVCPNLVPDPTPEQVRGADLATQIKAAARASIQPTKEALVADARKMIQAVVDGWDQEVEVIVILVPRGTLDNMAVHRFLHGDHKQRMRQIFDHILKKLGGYRRMNGS